MKVIKDYVEKIDEELEGAMDYAEKYVEFKAVNDIHRADLFRDMALDELKHAGNIHSFAVELIDKIKKIYPAPEHMVEKWRKAHREYIEHVEDIKHMLEVV